MNRWSPPLQETIPWGVRLSECLVVVVGADNRRDSPTARQSRSVPPRPGLATRTMLRRFQLEAEMLGQLQHPGIACIYEAGVADIVTGSSTASRQPFFAMELIRGTPLNKHADRRDLDMRARLELMARVCHAVQHTHQKGVIHRDLKSGNVFVDESGQPKILDFGVARAMDADLQTVTLHTHAGQIVGTVAYMSPEQVVGDAKAVDVRSDVYALGVIGFQLLTDRLPLDVSCKSIPDAVRVISDVDPPLLGAVNVTLRGDLEAIFAKALEKDPTRRYSSAVELGSDIRRFLDDQPILARLTADIRKGCGSTAREG